MRILLRQPALPHYRVPIFRRLADRDGVTLRVLYSGNDEIANVPHEGLDGGLLLYRQSIRPVVGQTYRDPGFREAVADFEPNVVILPWNARQRDIKTHLHRLRRAGIGTVLWGHGYSKQERPWRRWLRNRAGAAADTLLVYNHAAATRLRYDGFNPDRVFVAPNTLDPSDSFGAEEHWRARPKALEELRARRGWGGRELILFVSRMDPANRLDLLVQSLPDLVAVHPAAHVVAVGRGEGERSRLEALAARLGVGGHIDFTGPIYDPLELGGLMSLARVFCYPANIGLSILHAFAFGLPVVTSDRLACQNPEIESLRDGQNGRTYEHGNAGALGAVLAELLADDIQRAKLSEGARRTVREEYSPDAMVDGIRAACEAALRRGAVSRG